MRLSKLSTPRMIGVFGFPLQISDLKGNRTYDKLEENQALSGNSPIISPLSASRGRRSEYNAIVAKIESEFGAICRRRYVFKDRRDAEVVARPHPRKLPRDVQGLARPATSGPGEQRC